LSLGKKVIVIVGMPGSGKAMASRVARELGYPVLVCGDVIREEAKRRALPPTPDNIGRLMLKIREEEGRAIVACRLIPKIQAQESNVVVVEGARNIEEVDELRKHYDVRTLAIHASPSTRFSRLKSRGRSDDPKNWNDFVRREQREIDVGIGRLITTADRMIVNESSIQEFKYSVNKLLKEMCSE
jgi:dephospho-CoA kinase